MTIENSYFGELNRESIYSDSVNLYFINNQVGVFKTTGFSGSNNVFNFSLNTIESIESNAISVAFLTGEMSRSVVERRGDLWVCHHDILAILSPLCLAPRWGILALNPSACRSTGTHTTRVIKSYGSCYLFQYDPQYRSVFNRIHESCYSQVFLQEQQFSQCWLDDAEHAWHAERSYRRLGNWGQ